QRYWSLVTACPDLQIRKPLTARHWLAPLVELDVSRRVVFEETEAFRCPQRSLAEHVHRELRPVRAGVDDAIRESHADNLWSTGQRSSAIPAASLRPHDAVERFFEFAESPSWSASSGVRCRAKLEG